MKDNRRNFIRKTGVITAALTIGGMSACRGSDKKDSEKNSGNGASELNLAQNDVEWPVMEGPDTPKLCVNISAKAEEAEIRKVKQMGIDYVLIGGPAIPWKKEDLQATIDRFKSVGLSIMNMYIGGHPNTIYGKEGRDEEIAKIKESLVAAGAVGLPVVEYNFYADRLTEGYYAKKGRGGSGVTAYDYAPVKDLPAKPEIGTYTADQLWDNLTYFLKAVIPVAEKAGVRMAMHPNDPPAPVSHGSAQIMASFKDWKRMLDIVDSPSNGITYDCGVSREMGEDPLEVLHYLASHDRLNHMHFRNVIVQEPYNKYEEVFFDVGQVNMFAVMREVIKTGYKFGIFPEHERLFDNEKEGYPGGGGYTGLVYNVAYARAMMQAVLSIPGIR
jgi:mannonate dehydratase